MEIIAPHVNADFDALASLVAAERLYPGATMVQCRSVARNVRDFLALHKDRFNLVDARKVDFDAVTRLILVDVRRANRLRDLEPLVERIRRGDGPPVHIYDHHGDTDDDVQGEFECVEPVGAAITLLVEELQRRGEPVDPLEATLFMLGLYADTGSLTFANTTPRDISVASWLLARGASLSMVRRYLHAPMGQSQRDALVGLLSDAEIVELGGARIGVAVVPLTSDTSRLAEVVSHALQLSECDALFGIFPRVRSTRRAATSKPSKLTLIGRARVPWVDVGAVMAAFGGGGHSGAGAAAPRGVTAEDARRRVTEALEEAAPRPQRVRHVMSTPVMTLDARTPLTTAERCLNTWDVHGAPVVRDGVPVGVLSRRDIARARSRGRLGKPVAAAMNHGMTSVGPDATVEQALAQMVREDIGRLPVCEGGHLVGIIARSDLLRVLYPGHGGGQESPAGDAAVTEPDAPLST